MKIDIDLGQDNDEVMDVITAVNYSRMPKGRTSFARIFGTAIIVIGLILSWVFRANLYWIIGIIFIVIGFMEIYSSLDKVQMRKLKKVVVKNFDRSAYTGKRSYDFEDDGFSVTSDAGTFDYRWNVASGWGEYRNHIFLITDDGKLLIIDRRQLADEQADELIALYKSKIN